jgi:dihydrofolate reductase
VRRVRYQVACSLDGYIATDTGGYDWIVMDPDINFDALFAEFDVLLMGRRTYETMPGGMPGKKVYVFSRTLQQADHPDVTIVASDIGATVNRLRSENGKDIWLYGGGELFRSLLELDCIDTVEPAIIPVLLGGGTPFLPTPAVQKRLSLKDHRLYGRSGIVLLRYDVIP